MLHENIQLSKKSKQFLENLRVYLFSSGKKEKEIDEIVEELEDHLMQAEKNGKSIEHIIGQSPEAYMEQLASEMPIDVKAWMKYIPMILFGAFSFIIVRDLFEGTLSYSLLEIFGFLIIAILFLTIISLVFRYIAGKNLAAGKQFAILYPAALLPLALFVGLIFLNQQVTTPVINFGVVGTIIIGAFTMIFIIGFSIWSKTWVLPIVLAFVTLPDYLLDFTSLTESARIITGTCITFGCILIYLWISSKLAKV
ncbi:HAAS domain-containing protein [Oceanobacillus polygoni]|uniref:Membrane-anchored protein n=1 Tax=Oceanobacillus polygoni TaxID=1235259 RepID=A0A9X0YNW0_9BACI|nr:hypothetical protein [Oceanobacillus polygoni]MBP2076418.1 putative membrane-anchored protein [Oceanobacillus polygoni]